MEWHVWGPNDTVPKIYNDSLLLQYRLSQYSESDVVTVYAYITKEAGVTVYNAPGGNKLPSAPGHIPRSQSQQITHVTRAP